MRAATLTFLATASFFVIGYTNQQEVGHIPSENSGLSQALTIDSHGRPTIPPASEEELRRAGKARLYLAGFQSRLIEVVDPLSGHAMRQIRVTSMSPGVAISPDGSRLFVYDGNRDGKLLVIDTTDWRIIHKESITERAELILGNPLSLSGDGRWLLVQRYKWDSDRSWTSLFDTRQLRFRPDIMDRLRVPEGLRFVRIAGRPGYPRLYADFGNELVALDSETMVPLWRAATPLSREPGVVLAPNGERVYGLYPKVTTGCPCPDGRVHVTKMTLQLLTWAATTGELQSDIELTERLDVPTATIGRGDRGFMAIAPDGSVLYVVWEDMLWGLLPDSLEMVGELKLPALADGLAMSIDGHELYLVPATGGVRHPAAGLWTVDATNFRLIRRAADWPRMILPSLIAASAP